MITVFAGPTVSHDEIRSRLDCVCLPPVSHGDLIRLLTDGGENPSAIAIIDGHFEGVPSVWHKEILFAMDQGIPVYGSSSMGALRAAELDAFGMRGVGQIYEWYRDGVIEDDDEVAVLHGPAEVGYAVASEPMVSIRATLDEAAALKVISESERDSLIGIAKALFYKQRRWKEVFRLAGESGFPEAQLQILKAWLPGNAIDLKRNDALALLEMLSNRDALVPIPANYRFAWTHVWDRALQSIGGSTGTAPALTPADQVILHQLRMDPARYHACRDRAILSWLASHRVTTETDPALEKAELNAFRRRCGLGTRQQLQAYLDNVGLTLEEAEVMLKQYARIRQVRLEMGNPAGALLRQLKLDGDYLALHATIRARDDALAQAGIDPSSANLLRPSVLAWVFESRLNQQIPDDLDAWLADLDVEDADDWYRFVCADYLYWRHKTANNQGNE